MSKEELVGNQKEFKRKSKKVNECVSENVEEGMSIDDIQKTVKKCSEKYWGEEDE